MLKVGDIVWRENPYKKGSETTGIVVKITYESVTLEILTTSHLLHKVGEIATFMNDGSILLLKASRQLKINTKVLF